MLTLPDLEFVTSRVTLIEPNHLAVVSIVNESVHVKYKSTKP